MKKVIQSSLLLLLSGGGFAQTFAPTNLTGCVVWLDASQSVTQNGGVSRWGNLALSNQYDAVQPDAAAKPMLDYESGLGPPVIHFDGTNDFMTLENSATDLAFTGAFSVFAVSRTTGGMFSDGSGGFVGNFTAAAQPAGYRGWALVTLPDGTYGMRVGNAKNYAISGGSGLLGSDFVLLNGSYSNNGTAGTMTFYNSLLDTPVSKSVTPYQLASSGFDVTLGMFSAWNATNFASAVQCDIAEIVIYNRALNESERTQVWNYLSSKYTVATAEPITITDFSPTGYEEPTNTQINIRFNVAMDPQTMSNVIVGVYGLDGLPESNAWRRAGGTWAASATNTFFTFTPEASFDPGSLVMCEVPTNVMSAGGAAYTTSSRQTYSFIIDNGVSYAVTTNLIDPMAVVYHDNGDPHDLPLYLEVPVTTNPCPVMLWVHGGGWTGGDSGTWDRSDASAGMMSYYFTRKLGVAVAGVAWRSQSNSEGTFAKATNDISLAVQYVIDHAAEYNLDTHRIGLYGGSAGTPTSALVAQNNTNISCYIGFNGLYNFAHRTGTGAFGDGSSFAQDVPGYEANSAALHIRTNNPPDTLLMHGSADTTIEHEQSLWYADDIRAAGGSANVWIYQDEIHAFFNPGKPMHYPTMYAAAQHLIRVFNLDIDSMPDANGNGIPDEWESLWGAGGLLPGNDDDHDGLSNWQEYILGSNPEDSSSEMKASLSAAADRIQLTFPSVAATGTGYRGKRRTYQIEGCTNLLNPVWVSCQIFAATNGTCIYTNDPLLNAEYFRIRTTLQ